MKRSMGMGLVVAVFAAMPAAGHAGAGAGAALMPWVCEQNAIRAHATFDSTFFAVYYPPVTSARAERVAGIDLYMIDECFGAPLQAGSFVKLRTEQGTNWMFSLTPDAEWLKSSGGANTIVISGFDALHGAQLNGVVTITGKGSSKTDLALSLFLNPRVM